MAIIEINRNPSRRQLNQFGLLWLLFLSGLGALSYFKSGNEKAAFIFWGLAIAVPVVGWIFPAFMRLVFLGLSYAAFPIGFVVSHVILAVVYYLVLTPVGLMMRVVGYDPLKRRIERKAETYWDRRPDAPDVSRYFRQF